MWQTILSDLKAVVATIEAQASSALALFLSFIKEAVTEEEAALWPQFQALATQIFGDELKVSGLNVAVYA